MSFQLVLHTLFPLLNNTLNIIVHIMMIWCYMLMIKEIMAYHNIVIPFDKLNNVMWTHIIVITIIYILYQLCKALNFPYT